MLRDLLNKTYKSDKAPSAAPSAHSANAEFTSYDNSWLLDIRASHHLASDASNVPHSTLYTGNEGISVANDNILPIHCFDNIFLSSSSHNKRLLALKHILHTPYATSNLLSVHQLCADNNVFMEFYSNSRLDHPLFSIVSFVINKNNLVISSSSKVQLFCEHCQISKSHKLPLS